MTTSSTGKYTYKLVEDWVKLPEGIYGGSCNLSTDSQDRVYIFRRRQEPPVVVCDREGNYLGSWGHGTFIYPHGFHIANDIVYLTDRDTSMCMMYTLDGKPIQMLGKHGVHSDTGCAKENDPVLRPAGPFNHPTKLVPSPWGDLYVSDGHRNARVHRFDSGGHLIQSWGTWGKDPGQFHTLHSILVTRDRLVYVCDRENSRVQVFSADGEFKAMWTDAQRPSDIALTPEGNFVVSEARVREEGRPHRISIFDREGRVLSRWETRGAEGVWVDSGGDIYLALNRAKSADVDKYVRQG